jgi:DNA-binding transcriptional LysR family regulator
MSRVIDARVRTSAVQVAECVRSLFALELLQPGPHLYLCTPVLYNAIVLPNRMDQFSALFPEIETAALRLDAALAALAARGVTVRVIHEPGFDVGNLLPAIAGAHIARPGQTPLHHKGLLTQNLCLRGTLHFTADGIDLGGEEVELITDRAQLQRIALEMAAYWEELD